jgi:hypothetical protein
MRLRPVRIFIASPGDMEKDRNTVAAVVEELNRTAARVHGLTLEVIRWETHARPAMGRIQQSIFEQIGKYDVLMWRRYGTPSGKDNLSGTAEEFQAAYDSWRRERRPLILYYFSNMPAPPPDTIAEAEQLVEVVRFRDRLEALGLVWRYATHDELERLVRIHLYDTIVNELAPLPIAPALRKALDEEMERCRKLDVPIYTPSILLALFRSSDGIVRCAFDRLRNDAADDVVELLERYLSEVLPAQKQSRFEEIEWPRHDIVLAARKIAEEEEAEEIAAQHLLRALLRSGSKTIRDLRKYIGSPDFDRLSDVIADCVGLAPPGVYPTPGIFPGD